ncbi:MAG: GAF domain-containing protein [Chloroflexi bacterium]|nr:MAG: GAF domain-containing protein [Chloroflexota bacterium]
MTLPEKRMNEQSDRPNIHLRAITPRFSRLSRRLNRQFSLAEWFLYISFPLILSILLVTRPPIPFYALPLAPIALAAVLYEFWGGTLAALLTLVTVGAVLALDPVVLRRAATLQEAWPILSAYLAAGPLVGWLTARERERERVLVSAARRLHVVQEISQAIVTSLDLDETLHTILAETRRLISFDQGAVLLADRRQQQLRVMAVAPNTRPISLLVGRTIPLHGTVAGRVIQERRFWLGVVDVPVAYGDLRLLCLPGEMCLIVPLQFKREVIGVFVLAGWHLNGLEAADLDNLRQIAGQIAIAITHARLFAGQQARSRALAAISDAGREIAASLDLERTLRLVMRKAAETLPMDAGALFLFDQDAELYRVVVSHNLSSEHVEKVTFTFAEGVPGWVVQTKRPLMIPDATQDGRVHPYVIQEGVKSVLAIPLIASGQILGVLTLYCTQETHAFDEDALQLAQVFADQAAVFIQNAYLMDELRQAAADLEARVQERAEQLRQTQAQVIRAEKLAVVGRLAASVAHEVNNPLQAIALHLQLVTEAEVSDEVRAQLGIVQEELGRIAGIVQRLLDFQRPQAGEWRLYDVHELLEDVLKLAGKQLQQAGVKVECCFASRPVLVRAVGDQLKQVFLNLILNGVEAMPHGGRLGVTVQVGKNGRVCVEFADEGIGMSPEVMQHLFEPFFSTKQGGTGIGLAVSDEIVRRHGGKLGATSEEGQGSVFWVELPVCTVVMEDNT